MWFGKTDFAFSKYLLWGKDWISHLIEGYLGKIGIDHIKEKAKVYLLQSY